MASKAKSIYLNLITYIFILLPFCAKTVVKAEIIYTNNFQKKLSKNKIKLSIANNNASKLGELASKNHKVFNTDFELEVSTQELYNQSSLTLAQVPSVVPNTGDNRNLPGIIRPPQPPIPPQPPTPQPLPPPEQLLEPSNPIPATPESPSNLPQQVIKSFNFVGNTAFSTERLREEVANFTNRPISFTELLEARSAITALYVKNGYQTSGALIPPQSLVDGVVTIQVVEGKLAEIKLSGLQRLNPNYVRSRIAVATSGALNVPRLLEALRLLQLDPLISKISAELSAGTRAGTSLLTVQVEEADTFSSQVNYNNSRSPSVGSIRRGVQLREGNLLGLGDPLTISYGNTDGSDAIDINYSLPFNARNGAISLGYGNTSSRVIEEPFDILDIKASSRYFDLTLRQPLIQSPEREFAIGLTASRRETDTSYLEDLIGESIPFPSLGADDKGRIRVSALRFFQEWTQRNSREVISARSQFSVGLGVLSATVNKDAPDSRFFSWRGQAQWVRLLAPETLFLVRGDLQLSNRAILPIEQYGLGGQDTIRGYRQDSLLTDNGALLTAELRLPILRFARTGVLQVSPFVDFGKGWNNGNNEDLNPSTLASVGLGLQLNISDRLSARLDYGIPLISIESEKRTLQENGLHFSILFNPF